MGQTFEENFKDYYENYETGLVASLAKNKDVNRSIQGDIDIEVFNEDGTLNQKVQTTNCINNQAIFNAFYYQFLNSGCLGTQTVMGTNFGKIFLTDYAGAEDPSLSIIQGNIIGHADATELYAGTSAYQGTMVAGLSYITPSEFKYVIEFGANVANGRFQTVWFGSAPPYVNSPYNSEDGLGYCIKRTEAMDGSFYYNNGISVQTQDDKLIYNFGNGSNVYMYRLSDIGVRKTLVSAGAFPLPLTMSNAIKNVIFNTVTNEFWCATSSTIDGTIYAFKKDFSEYHTVNLPSNIKSGQKLLAYSRKAKKIFSGYLGVVAHYSVGDTTISQVEIYMTDAVTMETRTLTVECDAGSEAVFGMTCDASGNFLYLLVQSGAVSSYYNEYVYYIQDDGSLKLINISQTSEIVDKVAVSDYGNYEFIGQQGPILMKSFIEPGTQTLISSPVTKVQGQTMRLSYILTFK